MEEITEVSQLDGILERSHEKAVLIYKHSDTCGTAWRAEVVVHDAIRELADDPVAFVKLEVRTSRPLSDAIAETLAIRHESPQAILLVNGRPVWHTSHDGIHTGKIVEAVRAHAGR